MKQCAGCGELFSYIPGTPRCETCTRNAPPKKPVEFEGPIQRTCACGCGEEINQMPRTAHRMRRSGLKLTEIAKILDISYETTKAYTRQFSKRKRGHWEARGTRPKTMQPCMYCGVSVLTAAGWKPKCNKDMSCVPFAQAIQINCDTWDKRERELRNRQGEMARAVKADIPESLRARINALHRRRISLDKLEDNGLVAPYFDRDDDQWPYWAAQHVVGHGRRTRFDQEERSA